MHELTEVYETTWMEINELMFQRNMDAMRNQHMKQSTRRYYKNSA